jgi:hypothetical protein
MGKPHSQLSFWFKFYKNHLDPFIEKLFRSLLIEMVLRYRFIPGFYPLYVRFVGIPVYSTLLDPDPYTESDLVQVLKMALKF